MVTWLIDISNHQGVFDVGRAVSEGYAGVWMKATEGASFRDGKFDRFAEQTLASGAVPGAYHYLRAGSGREQCDAFYRRIRDHGGPRGWLVACDNEADASLSTTREFFARWRELAGDHPMFMYTGAWWWGPRGWDGSALTPYLWASRYVRGSGMGQDLYTKVPVSWWRPGYGGWSTATVLQFTSTATVAGQSVDVSAFRGSVDDLRRLTNPGTAITTSGEGENMVSLMRWSGGSAVVLSDGVVARWVGSQSQIDDILNTLGPEGTLNLGSKEVRVVSDKNLLGCVIGTCPDELSDIAAYRPGPIGPVALSDADRAAIREGLVSDVVALLAPQLLGVARLVERLGAAGDVLGALNDPPVA
jgi:hypothetical protein